MNDSILTSVKKILGIDEGYEAFDPDVIMHINTVFTFLHRIGIGPLEGFMIEDKTKTWTDFLGTDMRVNSVKSYVSLRVRLLFDPPTTSYLKDGMEAQVKEMEWSLSVQRENSVHPETLELDEIGDELFVVDGGEI